MNKLLTWLIWLFYPPCTPKGRQIRIDHLMQETGEIREVCEAIVYARDATRVSFTFTDVERERAQDLLSLIELGELKLPADRVKGYKP